MKSSAPEAATPDLLSRRLARREAPLRVPKALADEPGLFVVDATWGRIAPIELAPGVQTVGELEVIEHLRRGEPVIDTRPAEAYAAATIPGARNLPWRETEMWLHEFTHEPCVLFCNGPQCAATPTVVAPSQIVRCRCASCARP
jgi:hypothetical protein